MKRLSKYLRLRSKELQQILSCGVPAFNNDQLHALRVCIKKLKAVHTLSAPTTGKHKHTVSFKPIKVLFRKAGKVRDAQLTETYLKRHAAPESIRAAIAVLETQTQQENAQFVEQTHRLHKKIGKTIRGLRKNVKKLKRKEINRWISKQTEAASETQAQTSSQPAQWHTLRKILKSLGYIQQASHLRLQKSFFTDQHESITLVLGDWHDGIVIAKQIDVLISGGLLPLSENTVLAAIRGELVENGDTLLAGLSANLHQRSK